ncbi:uncharacterized protein J4E88_000101 [Alternaria novae-zelandiae]|uniref:uncharacterized protein n=1 Tax=Alternaria novae-zelandiae TaxID=430562 RepID=UPI0020C1DF1D|nr:uncharacterized protein J4E88_000101 [Alternaria novae-zelandiae]KAI4695931.1 hypothetical protein J4E88_000101 [Alternaria novae-zelandiae]
MAQSSNHISNQAKQGFVGLPAELREEIYGYYFRLEDGYTFNPATNKFVASHSEKNAMALSTVNKLVAVETRDFVVKYNELHFATVQIPSAITKAPQMHHLLTELSNAQDRALRRLLAMSNCYDEAARVYVRANHAQFLPLLDHANTMRPHDVDGYREHWKEVPSITRDFITATMDTIRPRFCLDSVAQPSEARHIYLKRLLEASQGQPFEPWRIPTDIELDEMQRNMDTMRPYDLMNEEFVECKQRFSAASVAIQYMKSLRPELRKKIRRIVLEEEEGSIAWPECHARGLIPFCQENKDLRIDRRIDIWKLMFSRSWNVMATTSSQTIAPWLMEAVVLLKLGMPQRAFKSTFVGDANPSLATQIFGVAMKDAAWQAALERRTLANFDRAMIRTSPAFIMAGFPRAMQDIADGTSIVDCNFPIAALPNETDVSRKHIHWSLNRWSRRWIASRTEINTSGRWPSYQAVIDLTFVPNTQVLPAPDYSLIDDVPGYPNDHTPVEISSLQSLLQPEDDDIEHGGDMHETA